MHNVAANTAFAVMVAMYVAICFGCVLMGYAIGHRDGKHIGYKRGRSIGYSKAKQDWNLTNGL
jgi:phosphate/sulfate permease